MDWLEEFFPFLRELDGGNGALEMALVILVIGVLAVIGLAAIRRARPATGPALHDVMDDDADLDDRGAAR
jgi:hypothetical protein